MIDKSGLDSLLNNTSLVNDDPALFNLLKKYNEVLTTYDASAIANGSLGSERLPNPFTVDINLTKEVPITKILNGATDKAPLRLGKFKSSPGAFLTYNLSFDGVSWNLEDITQAGYLLVLSSGEAAFYGATAGTNPRTITQLFSSSFASGNVSTQILVVSAGQIAFPATQNPSAGANVLDDYEEGAWTPTDVSGAGLGNFAQFSACVYQKVGLWVRVTFDFAYPVTGSGLVAAIGGLPFTVSGASRSAMTPLSANPAFPNLAALANAGTNLFTLFAQGGGGNITNAQAQNSVYVGCLTYPSTQ